MRRYPVYIAAEHGDGTRDAYTMAAEAADAIAAREQALKKYRPVYLEKDGWSLVVLVDEALAVDIDEQATQPLQQ